MRICEHAGALAPPDRMNYAALERASLAKRHLSKRYGPLLSRWSDLRRSEWCIDRSWSPERLLSHITSLREARSWELLKSSKVIAALDRTVRILMSCEPRRELRSDEPIRLSIEQI